MGGSSIGVRSSIVGVVLFLLPAAPLRAQIAGPFLPTGVGVGSTIPANDDLNPYGVATVPANFPAGSIINPGDILVSNFNNSTNAQGTGTTIVRIQASGPASLSSKERPPLG
jgi:hypothetical protein